MHKLLATLIIFIAVVFTCTHVSARPSHLTRQKRQSDQRLAELETLLALQKYGRHRLRPDRKDDNNPGFGVLDFNLLGRRKKSTGFSPGRSTSFRISSQDLVADPVEKEKIDSLINFPIILLHESHQPTIDFQQQLEGDEEDTRE